MKKFFFNKVIMLLCLTIAMVGSLFAACSDERQEATMRNVEQNTLIGEWIFSPTATAEESPNSINQNHQEYAHFDNNETLSIVSCDHTGKRLTYTYGYKLIGKELVLKYKSEFSNYICHYIYSIELLNADSLSLQLDKKVEDGKEIAIHSDKGPLVHCFQRKKL